VSALRVLSGGGEGGSAPWPGRLVSIDLTLRVDATAGTYEGDVAGFVGRALPIVLDLGPASAADLRRARLHAVAGGGEATHGRAVLRVAG
jgi:hypothetical protein